jgi:hypothetical protein
MPKLMRVKDITFKQIEELAKELGSSRQDIVASAVDRLMRETFFKKAERAYRELYKDKRAAVELQEEIELWDSTLLDGLDSYE